MSASEIENLWWASLTHGGLLITPARLAEAFSGDLEPLDRRTEERLRRDITRLSEDEKSLGHLLDTVFEQVLGMKVMSKEAAVDKAWSRKLLTGEQFRPNRLWLGAHGDVFPIFVVRARGEATPRLGVGRGRREVSKVLEWLRHANLKVGLLTNGQQFRLIHAGADYEAWCEWDTDFWFEEGRPGLQLEALRRLLYVDVIRAPDKDKPSLLVEAILASRRGQAQLSGVLGERVRQAVETLIRASAPVIEPLLNENAKLVHKRLAARGKGLESDKHPVTPNDVYIAATRIVMRLVVVLFAEARDLLPRDNPLYHSSYGLQGLREELDRAAGGRGNRLRQRLPSAWPRLLALFRLVSKGSGHEELPIPAYGGDLFAAGNDESVDGISRALAALESADNQIRDDVIHQVLDYLTRSPVKVRQGKASTVVMQPVAFSDLSSEYIGILYEGLLDYELKPVHATDGCMVFLNIGDEPALPIARLEGMDERALKALFLKLKAKKADDQAEDAEEEDDAQADEGEEEDEETSVVDEAADESDAHREAVARVSKWAKKAVVAAGLVKAQRGRQPDPSEIAAAQRKLVRRVLPAGEWFLVRWGGTRKGAGTFYTRPQLASPTAWRTLQPLAFDDAETPKKPEEILALKVCDPAMGSGSFLVSALRCLTDALLKSLYFHGRLESVGDAKTICRLADGAVATHPREETLPVPTHHPDFEPRLRARLKRHVVENCIYGVELDPVAVELARLALWIETMDRTLPFEFLDHKLKVGNALVGAWLDQLQDYPLMAFARDAGDKDHTEFVHHKARAKRGADEDSAAPWQQALSEFYSGRLRTAMTSWLKDIEQTRLALDEQAKGARETHSAVLSTLQRLSKTSLVETDERAALYNSGVRANEAVRNLRFLLDAWCSVWFWPPDELSKAPLPDELANPSDASRQVISRLALKHRFFHWELEFPDVFGPKRAGFDAIVGNPPWDTVQPMSKEFFSNVDPLYRTYTKQQALDEQKAIFERSPETERAWVEYQDGFRATANWAKYSGEPFGGSEWRPDAANADHLLDVWAKARSRRRGFAATPHPFVHQGDGKVYTYLLFLEKGLYLLRDGGRIGMLLPSGVLADKGATSLREELLDRCKLEWLFVFENRDKLFAIHSSFKYVPLIAQRGGRTESFQARFMVRRSEEWESAQGAAPYPAERIRRLSPATKVVVELENQEDVEIIDVLAKQTRPLGANLSQHGMAVASTSQGDLNLSSKSIAKRVWHTESKQASKLKAKLCALVDGSTAAALPIYQGAMFHQLDPYFGAYVGGSGHAVEWGTPDDDRCPRPQFWGPMEMFEGAGWPEVRIVCRRIVNVTNERTFMATLLPSLPSSDTTLVLTLKEHTLEHALAAAGVLNSFVFDWVARMRISGATGATAIDLHRIQELPFPVSTDEKVWSAVREAVCRLNFGSPMCSGLWVAVRNSGIDLPSPRRAAARTRYERLRMRCTLDALIAHAYGLSSKHLRWILRDCARPMDQLSGAAAKTLPVKGLWRVGRGEPPQLRHTVLTLLALKDLEDRGLAKFVNGDTFGWTMPDHVRLADTGIAPPEAAKERLPVASELGPQWAPGQRDGRESDNWDEAEKVAAQLDRLLSTVRGARTIGRGSRQGSLFEN